MTSVFVFNAARSSFPSAVFADSASATAWIARHELSGTLTEYPVGECVYDWAVSNGHFKPKRPDQESGEFIQSFTSASQWHAHFENGTQRA
jgi:hypothetical protein